MMWYDVTYKCGHEDRVQLYGKGKDRERKLWWYANVAVCPCCYKKQQDEEAKKNGCEEVTMKYAEYKHNYSGCKTKPDSYNAFDKTIVVYVSDNSYGVRAWAHGKDMQLHETERNNLTESEAKELLQDVIAWGDDAVAKGTIKDYHVEIFGGKKR